MSICEKRNGEKFSGDLWKRVVSVDGLEVASSGVTETSGSPRGGGMVPAEVSKVVVGSAGQSRSKCSSQSGTVCVVAGRRDKKSDGFRLPGQ